MANNCRIGKTWQRETNGSIRVVTEPAELEPMIRAALFRGIFGCGRAENENVCNPEPIIGSPAERCRDCGKHQ